MEGKRLNLNLLQVNDVFLRKQPAKTFHCFLYVIRRDKGVVEAPFISEVDFVEIAVFHELNISCNLTRCNKINQQSNQIDAQFMICKLCIMAGAPGIEPGSFRFNRAARSP